MLPPAVAVQPKVGASTRFRTDRTRTAQGIAARPPRKEERQHARLTHAARRSISKRRSSLAATRGRPPGAISSRARTRTMQFAMMVGVMVGTAVCVTPPFMDSVAIAGSVAPLVLLIAVAASPVPPFHPGKPDPPGPP